MRILLLPTGRAELKALPDALTRLFPGHSFEAVPWVDDEPFPGFTSSRLPAPPVDAVGPLDELIASAAALSDDADGVVILDDLELANVGQPAAVVESVRVAASRHLLQLGGQRAPRTAARLSTKVSLHLAVPMLESWFFADPGGLARAGVAASRVPIVASAPDYEGFRAEDPAFSADDGTACAYWMGLPEPKRSNKKNKPGWVQRGVDRARHPKDYLAWLRREPGGAKCTGYKETDDGAKALAQLDWAATLAEGQHLPFLRSLVTDLADLLGVPAPVPPGPEAPWTSRHHLPPDPILRNM